MHMKKHGTHDLQFIHQGATTCDTLGKEDGAYGNVE